MVSKAVVSTQVSTKTKASELLVVEANAIAIADMRRAVEEHHNGCAYRLKQS